MFTVSNSEPVPSNISSQKTVCPVDRSLGVKYNEALELLFVMTKIFNKTLSKQQQKSFRMHGSL